MTDAYQEGEIWMLKVWKEKKVKIQEENNYKS